MNGMNLDEYIKSLHIDDIEDDEEWYKMELETIRDYCIEHTFNLSDEDMKELQNRIAVEYFYDWMAEYEADISSPDPWYTEKWYDEDLILAMREEDIPVTRENLDKFRGYCRLIFDDKSERNAMLSQAVYECFDI